jgi:ribosomal-protein-alanine N-acetyltransferase
LIPTLFTPRLALRPYRLQDVDSLYAILHEPEILRYFPNPAPPAHERVERLISSFLDHWQQHRYGWWAVEPLQNPALAGWCGLTYLPETDEVEVAYLLGHAFWGKGLATEAAEACLKFGFEQVGLERIIAIVHPDNIASQRVVEKNGMTLLDHNQYFGMDCLRYELFRPSCPASEKEHPRG